MTRLKYFGPTWEQICSCDQKLRPKREQKGNKNDPTGTKSPLSNSPKMTHHYNGQHNAMTSSSDFIIGHLTCITRITHIRHTHQTPTMRSEPRGRGGGAGRGHGAGRGGRSGRGGGAARGRAPAPAPAQPPLVSPIPSEATILKEGLSCVGFPDQRQNCRLQLKRDRFRAFYGVSPKSVQSVIKDLADKSDLHFPLKDLLMALNWLRLYDNEHVLAGRWGLSEQTIREKVRECIKGIVSLKGEKIKWIEHEDNTIFVASVDADMALQKDGKPHFFIGPFKILNKLEEKNFEIDKK